MKFEIRGLKKSEALKISEEIKSTPNIIAYTPSELMLYKTCYVAYNNWQFIGCVVTAQHRKWIELKVALIITGQRNKGYGWELLKFAVNDVKKDGLPVYTVSRNPIFVDIIKQFGFKKTGLASLPLSVMFAEVKKIFNFNRIKEFFRKKRLYDNLSGFKYYVLQD